MVKRAEFATAVTGFGLLVGGAAMVWVPGALMLGGALLLAVVVWRPRHE